MLGLGADVGVVGLFFCVRPTSHNTMPACVLIGWRGTGGMAGLLGITIRHDSYESSDNSCLRVLDVVPGSPAASADLIPETDYILGTAGRLQRC